MGRNERGGANHELEWSSLKVKKDLYTIELRRKKMFSELQERRNSHKPIQTDRINPTFDELLVKLSELILKINKAAFYTTIEAQTKVNALLHEYIYLLSSSTGDNRSIFNEHALERKNLCAFMYMIERQGDFSVDILRNLSVIFKLLCSTKWKHEEYSHYSSAFANFCALFGAEDVTIEKNVS